MKKERLLASTLLAGAAAFGLSSPAVAQDGGEEASAGDQVITVTGSRIARPNQESPTAVQVINARQIEATGDINAGDILRTLPSIGVQGLTASNSNFLTQNNGLVTVDLRNLGEDRTLVLVNGRRFVSGVPGSQVVDFNTIPTETIDRIDVVTGGASAIYGSDGLAGVINIITDTDFEGFELFGQYGETERNNAERYRLGLKVGSNLDGGRGNVIGTLSYSTTGAVYARDYPEYGLDVDGLGGANFGGDTRDNFFPFFSSFTPQGVALVPRVGAGSLTRVVDATTGATRPYVGATDGFNRQNERLLYVPSEALHFTGQLTYEISESINFFTEAVYYQGSTSSDIEPTPLNGTDVYGAAPFCTGTGASIVCTNGIPLTSAVVPESLRAAVRAANPGALDENLVVGFQRRLTEFGNRANEADRSVARFVIGIDGDITDTLSYELSANWGRSEATQFSAGQVLIDRVGDTLDVIDDGTGNLVCRDPDARAAGCAPWFVFQAGGATPGAVQYAGIPAAIFDSFVEQFVLNGFVTGETTVSLPAGPILWSLGAEYRLEQSRNTPDTTLQTGLSNSNIAPETRGEFDVREVFGELRIPLLADLPLAQSLDLNLALRVSDYSTAGTTEAWAASLEYQPTSFLKFRTQYAEAVRAPNISELFQGRSQTFPSVTDPCAGLTLSGGVPGFLNNPLDGTSGVNAASVGGSTATACFSDPSLAARVARDGFFVQTQPELQGVSGFNEGNPNLEAEESESFTFGLLFNPDFNTWFEPLAISVDYYNIEITGAIQGVSRGTTLTRCYGGSIPGALDPLFCNNITRFGVNDASVGALQFVDLRVLNIGGLNTSGIDVQASYALDLNDLGVGPAGWDLGALAVSVTYQHVLEYETQSLPGTPFVSSVGTTGLPENEALVDLLYERGPLQWTWQAQIIGESCFFGTECEKDNYIDDLPIGVRVFWDTQLRYDVTDTTSVFFGVDNVFDEYQRIGQSSGQPTGHGTDPNVFDPLGRRFYAGARLRF